MEEKKKALLPPYVILMLVAIVMSFAISGVYLVTKDRIEEAAAQAQYEARAAVMPDAADMEELPLEENAAVDYCYAAYDASGALMGYVSQVTVIGFGGEIEVTVGVDTGGSITAISVGGQSFSETSGLGARTREPAFTEQFQGKSGTLVLKKDIDSVSGASISSGAVVSGVNKALQYMSALLPEGASGGGEEPDLTEETIQEVLPGAENVRYMGGGSGIDGWWQADNGYIVRATGFGEGPIAVTVGFGEDGTVAGIGIGDENFMETEGRGDGVLADWYKEQFLGRSGYLTYGDGLDAISGATVTSNATLAAINACMTFDPSTPDAEIETPAVAAEEPADAETSATETEGGEEENAQSAADAERAAVPDSGEASDEPVAEEPADAETSATEAEPAEEEIVPSTETESMSEEQASPVEEPADAETSASVTEEEETAAAALPESQETASEETVSEETASGEATSGEAASDETASEEASSEEASGEPDAETEATGAVETPAPTPDTVTEATGAVETPEPTPDTATEASVAA